VNIHGGNNITHPFKVSPITPVTGLPLFNMISIIFERRSI